MRRTVLTLAAVALAMFLAGGMVMAQTTPPEHSYNEFAAKWSVDSPPGIVVDSRNNVYVVDYDGIQRTPFCSSVMG